MSDNQLVSASSTKSESQLVSASSTKSESQSTSASSTKSESQLVSASSTKSESQTILVEIPKYLAARSQTIKDALEYNDEAAPYLPEIDSRRLQILQDYSSGKMLVETRFCRARRDRLASRIYQLS